jgi:hypothetical protein
MDADISSSIEKSPMELKNQIYLSSNNGPNWDPSQGSSSNNSGVGSSSNNPDVGSSSNTKPSIFTNPDYKAPPVPERA